MVLFTDFDHRRFSKEVGIDIATFDLYPLASVGSTPEYSRTGDPDVQALNHALFGSVLGASYGKTSDPFGVIEMQSGVFNWNTYRVSPLEGIIRLWTYETFAASGDMVNYFRWRQVPYAQEPMLSGLFVPDNSKNAAYMESQVFAKEDCHN